MDTTRQVTLRPVAYRAKTMCRKPGDYVLKARHSEARASASASPAATVRELSDHVAIPNGSEYFAGTLFVPKPDLDPTAPDADSFLSYCT